MNRTLTKIGYAAILFATIAGAANAASLKAAPTRPVNPGAIAAPQQDGATEHAIGGRPDESAEHGGCRQPGGRGPADGAPSRLADRPRRRRHGDDREAHRGRLVHPEADHVDEGGDGEDGAAAADHAHHQADQQAEGDRADHGVPPALAMALSIRA